MAQGDGLRPLQVGVSGHDGVCVCQRLFADHAYQPFEKLCRFVRARAEIQSQVHRHLVVAAAGGVQALAGVADAAGELLLHEGVDVLAGQVDL